MDFNNSLNYTVNLNTFSNLTIIYIFELILLLLSMLIIFIVFFILTSTGLLHIHLIRLTQICGTFYLISAFFRIATIIGNKDVDELLLIYGPRILTKIGVFGYFYIFRAGFSAAAIFIFVFILYERTLATLMYKSYETWSNIFVIIIPFIIALSSSALFCLIFFDWGTPIIYYMTPCFFFGFIGFVLLFGSYFYNLRKYKLSQKLHSYNLSHKFQLSENIRSIDLIWKACFIMSGDIGFAVLAFVLPFFVPNSTLKYSCLILVNYIIASVIILSAMTLLITPTWRNLFFSKLRSFKRALKRNSPVEDKNIALQQVKNLEGQRLVLPPNEEQDLYFQQLQASWK